MRRQQWKPSKPITIIVPWAAGGSTDQVTRVTAAELEKPLGQKVVSSTSPARRARSAPRTRFEAPKDGYTWTAGAAQGPRHATSALGMLETKLSDWHLYLNVAHIVPWSA